LAGSFGAEGRDLFVKVRLKTSGRFHGASGPLTKSEVSERAREKGKHADMTRKMMKVLTWFEGKPLGYTQLTLDDERIIVRG
jgi:hypothetical protein